MQVFGLPGHSIRTARQGNRVKEVRDIGGIC